MTRIINGFLVLVSCATLSMLANANTPSKSDPARQDPYQIIQETTEQVLAIVKDSKDYYESDPEKFNTQITQVLDSVIDFESFTRGVMGTYASGQRYKSLKSEKEKAEFRERFHRFTAVFKQEIINTYASHLADFNGGEVDTLPPRKGDNLSSGSVTVMQSISNGSGKPYLVQYRMRRNKAGEWKLQNLIVEGINLGLTYRSQFTEATNKYGGDIDKVIDNWTVSPQQLKK